MSQLDATQAQALLQDILQKSKDADAAQAAAMAADAAAKIADAAIVTAEQARKASLATIEAFLEANGATAPTPPAS